MRRSDDPATSVDPPPLGAVVHIRADADIVEARQRGRALAQARGFQGSDLVFIATAISEVARNILRYAGSGEVEFGPHADGVRDGIVVVARDQGPGIPDVALALRDGYSSGQGLGLGLPGARRLVDELEITSAAGQGTTVTLKKWLS